MPCTSDLRHAEQNVHTDFPGIVTPYSCWHDIDSIAALHSYTPWRLHGALNAALLALATEHVKVPAVRT